MLLSALRAAVPEVLESRGDTPIAGITDDSRQVKPGFVFVAVPGVHVDGHRFIPAALRAGAAAVVIERPALTLDLPSDLPYLRVANARRALGWLHAAWHGFPSRQLTLFGVTGTDGKTTTTNLLYAILCAAGHETGMISTVNARIGALSLDTGLHTTTPPSGEVQDYLAQMVAAGATHAVLETTSEGLAQQRLAGCDFDVAVVTNITHEHVTAHGSWEAYREAKATLFRSLATAARKPDVPKVAVLNRDDPGSFDYLRAIPVEQQVIYGLDSPDVDVTATDIVYTPQGIRAVLRSPWGTVRLSSPLVGAFNVSNILAAASAALALGISRDAVVEGVAAISGIPGRMERIDEGQPFTAIVDFAHTPNALRVALLTARQWVAGKGRVIVVFGSAGLRDREKRRMMGEVAGELADLIVLTAEDPRTEPLDDILAEMAEGVRHHSRVEGVDFWRIPDRGAALLHAVRMAQPDDIVLACGKGHEQSMCFGTVEYPWDDREALRRALHGETLDTLPTHGEREA
ncbi:MAG TPA: UDP-N-acetylmuramoyl-L-alanyl-D-glutamate--2,6-diaminopimelate ligase [Anaerolineae bacterium]|nr:UDP-N-acetylmuramoyl-L-alanyl-D-glutamate--2,6-diaminopimelate ligase [Anaerolineae bacterium]HQI86675.1 UDP-N-acetylmuramoyl-L-alanyl-D-glutamate--2,6-diaminopimelate ligase [Anaerolineae bacterium]HQK13435.1 UDP-N-acetylmuramoyl-L-alanyl-D-glutamate--2,6-diaminopimelate ligase [Anaerolineae bacterium]